MSDKSCLIIGASPINETLKKLASLREQRVFIYEGDKDVCASLCRQVKESFGEIPERLSVIEQFVTADGNTSTYYEFNISAFNALAKPELIFELYPNLKITNTREFDTISIIDVVQKHHCDGAHSMLMINAAAQANSLVSKLIDSELLVRFSEINAVASAEEWYESSHSQNYLKALLASADFELDNEHTLPNDSDFSRLIFSLKRPPADPDESLDLFQLKQMY